MKWYFIIILQVSAFTATKNSIDQVVGGMQSHLVSLRDSRPNLADYKTFHSPIRTKQAISSKHSINLHLLSNGALKLPAEITIRRRLYNITKGFMFSPNYLGHPSDDPTTTVVIRTNHIYGIYENPEVFISQLDNTERSGLLMDYDTRYSILVVLDVNNLRRKARQLAYGVLKFPYCVMIGKTIFVITHQMAMKEDYVQHFGYSKSNPSDRFTLKTYFRHERFQREVFGLTKLGRLHEKDSENMIVVTSFIDGWTLDYLLKHVYRYPRYMFKFLDNYIPTIQKLHLKWEISHGNINALNIMIKTDGSIELINFEYSQSLSHWNAQMMHDLMEKDTLGAHSALESQSELISALKAPLKLDSQRFLWKYISDMGQIHGSEVLKLLWYSIRQRQTAEFENSKNSSGHRDRLPLAIDAKNLSDPSNLRLPFTITVGINQYRVTEYISTGAQGSAYRGFFVEDPSEKIVLKIYKQPNPEKHFLAERFALVVTGRLRDEDCANLITVQKEIPGQLLSRWYVHEKEKSEYTGKSIISKEDLFKEITQLLLAFHTKWSLAHNDVRPQNIIRKPDGSLELIDFGFSGNLWATSDKDYQKRIERDFVKAQREYEFYFDGLAANDAFKYPSREKLPIVREYVKLLWKRGEHERADSVWRDFLALI